MEASQSCLPVRLEEITGHFIQGFAKDQRQSGADHGGGSGPAGLGELRCIHGDDFRGGVSCRAWAAGDVRGARARRA